MFITIENNEVQDVEIQDVSKHPFCIGIMEQSQLREHFKELGIDEMAVEECINNSMLILNSIDVYENFSFGMISTVDMYNVDKMRKDFGFIIQKDLFLFVVSDEEKDLVDEEILRKALEKIRMNASPERMVASVLEQLLFKGNEELVFTENIIIALEEQVLKLEHAEEISSEVMALRTRVSTLKNFYDQMIDIGEALKENSNNIFRDEELRYMKNFITKAERMKERSQGMNDNLIHIWELLDAAMNNKLNDTMKVLTIISVIFQPLTMITGWYGMNFINMPELNWEHGYLLVIILNILIVVVITSIFKKKKLL